MSDPQRGAVIQRLPIDTVERSPFQPRREFAAVELDQLASSLRRHGMLQPIVVRPLASGRYELVAGERRWRAAQQAGWSEIPAAIRPLTDGQAAELAIVENLQRQNLGAIELAQAIARLIADLGLTHEEVAATLGAERSTVSNWLRLLELHPEVQAQVGEGEGQLRAGHAKVLAGLKPAEQKRWAQRVIHERLSVRQLEAHLVRAAAQHIQHKTGANPDLARLERELGEHLGTQVRIDHTRSGNGQLVLKYGTLDALQGLLERLGYRE
jgi:ParB family transcriptional regulator, chromosome partitioning protein